MTIEPGKTYRMKPAIVNGVLREKRLFRVDEVVDNGRVVRGALDGEYGWTYAASALIDTEMNHTRIVYGDDGAELHLAGTGYATRCAAAIAAENWPDCSTFCEELK